MPQILNSMWIKLVREVCILEISLYSGGTCRGWIWSSILLQKAKYTYFFSLPIACVLIVIQASHPHDCPCSRFMTDAARREQESLKKKIQPKLSLTLSSTVSRGNVSTPPRHSSGSLTPPVTPPITPSSSFRSSTPTGKHILCCLSPHQLAFFLCGFQRTVDVLRHQEEEPLKVKQKSFRLWEGRNHR